MLGYLFRNISRLYMTFDEKGKVVKSVQPIKTSVSTRSYFQGCGAWEGWKGYFFQIRVITNYRTPNNLAKGKSKLIVIQTDKNRLKGQINWRKARNCNVI
jgi:hypothetical protein